MRCGGSTGAVEEQLAGAGGPRTKLLKLFRISMFINFSFPKCPERKILISRRSKNIKGETGTFIISFLALKFIFILFVRRKIIC